MRRQQRPRELRCLAGATFGLMVMIFALAFRFMEGALCSMLATKAPSVVCLVFPPAAFTVLQVLSFAGFTVTLYRAYRDFYRGDYYLDLAKAGYL